jgi:hypothetical protein
VHALLTARVFSSSFNCATHGKTSQLPPPGCAGNSLMNACNGLYYGLRNALLAAAAYVIMRGKPARLPAYQFTECGGFRHLPVRIRAIAKSHYFFLTDFSREFVRGW